MKIKKSKVVGTVLGALLLAAAMIAEAQDPQQPCMAAGRNAEKKPHYRFILPDGYIGWVQIVFNDPQAPSLVWKSHFLEIEVPESGVTRTSRLRVEDDSAPDEFYYRIQHAHGDSDLRPVPCGYVLPGFSHGGFGVMDTGGKGPGYSWFIFVGPPELRAKIPFANWDKVVADYAKTHGGKMRIESSGPYPTPGRMIPGDSMQR